PSNAAGRSPGKKDQVQNTASIALDVVANVAEASDILALSKQPAEQQSQSSTSSRPSTIIKETGGPYIEDRHRQFTEALALFTGYRVHVIEHKVEAVSSDVDASFIFQLLMVASAPSSVHRTCLQGTRQAVLQTIQNWAEDDTSDKPIFWLCDIAGSGKSTVAMSAASWHVEGTLGGQFFLHSNSDTSTIEKFCSTMARDLAQHIPELAPHVADAVKRNPSIMRSSLEEQFHTLIIDPLRHRDGRVVLVVDAIDECKSGPQRKELVDTLAKAVRQSKSLKVFITSRPDAVIESVLQPLSIKCKLEDRLHDVKHRDNVDDIATYVHQSLYTVLPEDKRRRLIEKARDCSSGRAPHVE
ncbi:SubName: Full=Related to archipelago beta form (F-box-WD40 repeat protein) {ECO:0000313/EMBL:CCA74347.1}, partial [Serendipita indica DSM 11827]